MKTIEKIFALPGLETIINSSMIENEPFQFKAAFWHFENDASFYMFNDNKNYKMLIANDKFLNRISEDHSELDEIPHYQIEADNPIQGLVMVINQIEPTNEHYLLVMNDMHDNLALVCMENMFDLDNLNSTIGETSLLPENITIENTILGEDSTVTVAHW